MIDVIKYDSGQIKRIGHFHNEKKVGQWVAFFESGLINWIGNYAEGKEFGVWKEWYKNGNLKEDCYYTEGIKVPLSFWSEDGNKLLHEGTGFTIEKYGTNDYDIYKHHYVNGNFISEEKIESVSYGGFKPSDNIK